MTEISDYLQTKPTIQGKYKVLTVNHPKIEEQYGTILIVKVTLNNKENKPLVVVPGYSNDSFMTGFNLLMDGFDSYKDKYSVMYALCWGSTVKKLTTDYSAGIKDEEEAFKKNEEIRLKLAHVLDKIIRSPDMELSNITIFSKSAGAGVSIHIASMNLEVKSLYISCPGTSSSGSVLSDRKDLPIFFAWNVDDPKLPYVIHKEFIKVFDKNGNNYKFYSYKTGGHEFNPEFILLL